MVGLHRDSQENFKGVKKGGVESRSVFETSQPYFFAAVLLVLLLDEEVIS